MALSDFDIAVPDGVMRKAGRTEPSRPDSGGSVGIVIAPGMANLFIRLKSNAGDAGSVQLYVICDPMTENDSSRQKLVCSLLLSRCTCGKNSG